MDSNETCKGHESEPKQKSGRLNHSDGDGHGAGGGNGWTTVRILTKRPAEEKYELALNPLLMEHVVENIISHLPWDYTDGPFLALRTVCKTWRDVITRGMRREAIREPIRFINGGCTEFPQFMAMRATSNLPFSSVILRENVFNGQRTAKFVQFLRFFSADVTHLTLSFQNDYILDLKLIPLEVNFAKLTSLSFHCAPTTTVPTRPTDRRDSYTSSSSDDEDVMNDFSRSHKKNVKEKITPEILRHILERILSSANKLETLDVIATPAYFEGSVTDTLEVGKSLAENLPNSVVNLYLTMALTGTHFDTISGKGLRLKKFRCRFYGSFLEESGTLEGFIGSHASSLTQLWLEDFGFYKKGGKHYAMGELSECLSKVTYLQVQNEKLFVLKSCPSVQRLELLSGGWSDKEAVHSTTITELSLLTVKSPQFFKDLPSCLPNLNTLEMEFYYGSKKATRAMFQHLGCMLKDLKMTFHRKKLLLPSDPIFTGMTWSECEDIENGKKFGREAERKVLSEVTRAPCLENLKNLEILRLAEKGCSMTLSDVTVHYAFFRCPKLKKIHLASHEISWKCLEALKERLQVYRRY